MIRGNEGIEIPTGDLVMLYGSSVAQAPWEDGRLQYSGLGQTSTMGMAANIERHRSCNRSIKKEYRAVSMETTSNPDSVYADRSWEMLKESCWYFLGVVVLQVQSLVNWEQ